MEKKRKFDVLAWARMKPLAASRKLFEFLQKARYEEDGDGRLSV